MNPSPIEPEEAVKRLSDRELLLAFAKRSAAFLIPGEPSDHDHGEYAVAFDELSRRLADRASMAERVADLEACLTDARVAFHAVATSRRLAGPIATAALSMGHRIAALLHPKGEQR